MAVAENAGAKIGSSSQDLDSSVVSSDSTVPTEAEKPKQPKIGYVGNGADSDQTLNGVFNQQQDGGVPTTVSAPNNNNYKPQMGQMRNGVVQGQQIVVDNGGGYGISQMGSNGVEDGGESFKRDMRDLAELLSKLNPMAEEFVPPSLAKSHGYLPGAVGGGGGGFGYTNSFLFPGNYGNANGHASRRRKNGYSQGKQRANHRIEMEKREEMIRRTVYVSDIDQQVTEEQLATLFLNCGQVVDCRVCGDPNSILRFAFIEFTDEDGARAALNLSGTMLGYYPVRVLPSKTAIAPVNPSYLPRSEDEREMCSRTIYCTNIDKKVTQADVKLFFESLCGEVQRLRLLGDYHHSTRIAFVEFTIVPGPFAPGKCSNTQWNCVQRALYAESAIAALNCSGVILGSLPIRVSPSKTPVRSRAPRTSMH